MRQAEQMFERLKNGHDQTLAASFEEIEKQARQARRKMRGQSLEIMIGQCGKIIRQV